MITPAVIREIALSFEETDEHPHMEHTSFRVKKKIFMSMNEPMKRICVKLSPIDQDVFCRFNSEIIYPVPNAWGRQGWTLISLAGIRKSMVKDAITCAYCNVAPKKLVIKYLL